MHRHSIGGHKVELWKASDWVKNGKNQLKVEQSRQIQVYLGCILPRTGTIRFGPMAGLVRCVFYLILELRVFGPKRTRYTCFWPLPFFKCVLEMGRDNVRSIEFLQPNPPGFTRRNPNLYPFARYTWVLRRYPTRQTGILVADTAVGYPGTIVAGCSTNSIPIAVHGSGLVNRNANHFIPRCHPYTRKPASRADLSRMPLNRHATRRTIHGASHLVLAKSNWPVTTRRAPSRHYRDARV